MNVPPAAARTSETHPLQIAALPIGNRGGAVGFTLAPGKHQAHPASGRPWWRDLETDLDAIAAWGASDLISLIECHEFKELQIEALPDRACAHGLKWHGLPIRDGDIPDQHFLDEWATQGPEFARGLIAGGRIVVHCKGGLGRAGMVTCMLLMETGAVRNAKEAIDRVRRERRGAVETYAQERFLENFQPRTGSA